VSEVFLGGVRSCLLGLDYIAAYQLRVEGTRTKGATQQGGGFGAAITMQSKIKENLADEEAEVASCAAWYS
jgi:hypothetical protein